MSAGGPGERCAPAGPVRRAERGRWNRQRALVGGEPAVVSMREGGRLSVMVFTIERGRIVALSVTEDPVRLPGLDLTVLDG
ncbi:hypothetical protein [Streptomyces sp. NPDC006971]|uniref:hypothetical protein n=1 Tax=Streptomyces sp. NPDC006971 TaxID=3154784 RepID=UPI00340EB272